MKTIKITILFLIFVTTSFGQKLEFDIHNLKLEDFIRLEEELESEIIPNKSNYMLSKGIAQPIQFLKKQDGIPDKISQYFYYKKDSTIAYILHEWDVYNFEKKDNNRQSEKFQLALIKKYNSIESKLTQLFGKSTVEGNLDTLVKANERGGLKKKNIWNPNDSLEIEMYTSISNYYEKIGTMTINPTHRIRLYIRNKKDVTKQKELTEQRLDSLVNSVKGFIEALKKEQFIESRAFLSELIFSQTTDEQLREISSMINFNEEIDLIYYGIQMGMHGDVFIIMQFKYLKDDSTPLKEKIKVIFNEKDKIVGFQPLRME